MRFSLTYLTEFVAIDTFLAFQLKRLLKIFLLVNVSFQLMSIFPEHCGFL